MESKNKLAKLRRHSSWVHFASNSFGPIHFVLELFRLYTLGFEHVGHYVDHLVHPHVDHYAQLSVGHFFLFFWQPLCRPPCRPPCQPPCRPPRCRLNALRSLRDPDPKVWRTNEQTYGRADLWTSSKKNPGKCGNFSQVGDPKFGNFPPILTFIFGRSPMSKTVKNWRGFRVDRFFLEDVPYQDRF